VIRAITTTTVSGNKCSRSQAVAATSKPIVAPARGKQDAEPDNFLPSGSKRTNGSGITVKNESARR